jgi:hypothetical protein
MDLSGLPNRLEGLQEAPRSIIRDGVLRIEHQAVQRGLEIVEQAIGGVLAAPFGVGVFLVCKGRMKLPQMCRVKNPQTVCQVIDRCLSEWRSFSVVVPGGVVEVARC